MAKSSLINMVAKAVGFAALPVVCALFAAYSEKHFPGWAFALSLVLLVAGSVPAVLFFNLFRYSGSKAPSKPFEFSNQPDEWDDLFSPWIRDDYRN
ncbi:hypothetical protein [Pseudomonas fluorescens]|uniref:Uncharacterized protein n=1 Tax=Pseudomonas fluorescens TaxID=294 RepID=A0A5E7QF29_PSEFL|nr:hypothetical protein [Pseudomonas fluorescens]VVP60434.1 hypothetical protein PS880_06151 [Pseudomonas fluorescens]